MAYHIELTIYTTHPRNMIIVKWSRWAMLTNALDVANEIFLNFRLEKQIGQGKYAVNANFFGMFGQFEYAHYITASNLKHHCYSIFLASH